jgi:pyruvyl transferase EpsI
MKEISQAKAELKAELSCVMKEISQAKAELKAELSCVMTEISQQYQLKFRHDYAVANLIQKKKVFLVGTAEHSNIGDAAIVAGEYEFIKKFYPDHAVIEISTYLFEQQYPLMRATITNDDVIFLHGGGNLGTLYLNEENVRRTVLRDYPNHKTVILPQTIYFSPNDIGDAELRISSTIYNNHKNLILFTRGLESLRFAKEHFPNVKSANALDSAHILNGNFGYVRNGTLLCIRDLNDESGLTERQYKAVHEIVANEAPGYNISNNIYRGDIPKEIRRRVVDDELQLFARHKVIVTDRLHGLIFSVITRTPCVLISAYNQKIAEFADNFSDSNAVFFIDKDFEKLSAALQSALSVSKPHYPALDDAKPFDAMYSLIDGRTG